MRWTAVLSFNWSVSPRGGVEGGEFCIFLGGGLPLEL